MELLIEVKEVRGICPVYKVRDSFRIKDCYRLVTEIPLCMHSLASLFPYYSALRVSSPDELGIAGKEKKEKGYVQCSDVASYTGGGTVIFEITRIDE